MRSIFFLTILAIVTSGCSTSPQKVMDDSYEPTLAELELMKSPMSSKSELEKNPAYVELKKNCEAQNKKAEIVLGKTPTGIYNVLVECN